MTTEPGSSSSACSLPLSFSLSLHLIPSSPFSYSMNLCRICRRQRYMFVLPHMLAFPVLELAPGFPLESVTAYKGELLT